jgi:aspartate carbamoyltransferase catalytic subunit
MTRLQKERFNISLHEQIQNHYRVTKELLNTAKPNMKILHPLPRLEEIKVEIDKMPQAYYFEQAANAIYVRAALLAKLLSKDCCITGIGC